eukprot:363748-Chlamydomonas_euryale.AAC.4
MARARVRVLPRVWALGEVCGLALREVCCRECGRLGRCAGWRCGRGVGADVGAQMRRDVKV